MIFPAMPSDADISMKPPVAPRADAGKSRGGLGLLEASESTAPPTILEAAELVAAAESTHLGWLQRSTLGKALQWCVSRFSAFGAKRESGRTPAALVSLIVHLLLFLILAIWGISGQNGNSEAFDFQVQSGVEFDDRAVAEMTLASGDAPPPPAPTTEPLLEAPAPSESSETAKLSELLTVETMEKTATDTAAQINKLFSASGSSLSPAFVAMGVDGRQPAQRKQIALARGGTLESEQAVEDALDWLAAHQLPNGAWSLVHDGGECDGRCGNPGSHERFDPAATGLSLLAFLGAGYTHQAGKHQKTVHKGVYYLLQVLEETPQGGSFLYQSDRGMYNHGIAAFALCEAYQLSRDKDLKRPAEQAIEFIVNAQSYQGGWGYTPKKPGDLTISGWQAMALKSAFAAEIEVPTSTLRRMSQFLDTQADERGVMYGYGTPTAKSTTCTSIGMMLRMMLGTGHTDPRILEGSTYLLQLGPSNNDIYFNYYATLALFHVGGGFWKEWNPLIREHLIASQARDGHERGSWYFDNAYGKEGGRLYTTAMAAMTLEVYYRFSPLYQQAEAPFEL